MGITAVMGRLAFDQAVQTFHVMGETYIGFDKFTTCRHTVFRMFLLLVGLGESLTKALAHGAGQHFNQFVDRAARQGLIGQRDGRVNRCARL